MTHTLLDQAQEAAIRLAQTPATQTDHMLHHLARLLEAHTPRILEANALDLQRMPPADPKRDRLLLTPERIGQMAQGLRQVAGLPSPLGRELLRRTLPNGLRLRRMSVPFGVIGVIYEARPNVTTDVAALCLKAGSACVLKGGSDAHQSNQALCALVHEALRQSGLPSGAVGLLPPTREATDGLLQARGQVDLLIPRGSAALIRHVREAARVPVIETGAGVVHTYVDEGCPAGLAARVVENAKTRRVSVCNALDCLLLHRSQLPALARVVAPLAAKGVTLYADEAARAALSGAYPTHLLQPATETSYGTEFLDYKMALRTVDSVDEAILHIRRHGSGHSESILSPHVPAQERFVQGVDAACVYVNAPTSFTDGGEFGLGAEIGISTQKLHARGPMGLEEICTYKWVIEGEGQVR